MSLNSVVNWVVLLILSVSGLAFLVSCLLERERRAFWAGFLGLSVCSLALAPLYFFKPVYFDAAVLCLGVGGLISFLGLSFSFNKNRALEISGEQTKVDERDAFFHRFMILKKGTQEYDAYYQKYPDQKALDEKISQMPGFDSPESKSFHLPTSSFKEAVFSSVGKLASNLDDQSLVSNEISTASKEEVTRRIKGFAEYLGADIVGCTKLNPAYIYSNIGRGEGQWGKEIELNHSFAIVIATEMSHDMVRLAPQLPTVTETSIQYFETAKIACMVADYIKKLGYESRAHVDSNYRVMCVPIAVDAGIGELGRSGILITRKFGPRVRLSVVTTSMPLTVDSPIALGVQDFCSFCKKCAELCPSKSIDEGEKRLINGVKKWQSKQEGCFKYWRTVGTDCGLCIKVCPYAHASGGFHRFARWFATRNHFSRKLLLWGDDLFYGRRPRGKYPVPKWLKK